MRHSPVVFATIRKAVEDLELGGVRLPAGTQVIVNTAAANRDPAVYDDPDRLDITREGPAPCSRSAAAFTTAWEHTSPEPNSPKP
jgi:cytochrome P450